MVYIDFMAGGKEYKLRLNVRNIVLLEDQLGMNPIYIFNDEKNNHTPTTRQMVEVLHAALQVYQEGKTIDDAYAIFDEWLEDGHIITEFVGVITEIYTLSGLFTKDRKKRKNG